MVDKSRHLRRRGSSALIAMFLLAAVILTPTSSARADDWHFGGTDGCGFTVGNSGWQTLTSCVSMANNRWHAVHYGVVGNQWDGIDDATTWVLANRYDPLDLVAYVDQNDPLPDVIVYDSDVYGNNNFVAWVDCPANNSGSGGAGDDRWCRGQILRYNGNYEDEWQDTNNARRGLACHEMGHTLGLQHLGAVNSCMRTNHENDANGLWFYDTWLRSHDRTHLNDAY